VLLAPAKVQFVFVAATDPGETTKVVPLSNPNDANTVADRAVKAQKNVPVGAVYTTVCAAQIDPYLPSLAASLSMAISYP
jgi:hypothetical protein